MQNEWFVDDKWIISLQFIWEIILDTFSCKDMEKNMCLLNLDLTLVPKTFTSFTSVASGHDVVEKLAYDLEYVDVSQL